MIKKIQLSSENRQMRLDVFLAGVLPECSRSYLQKLIKSGAVTINNEVASANKTPLPDCGILQIEIPEIAQDALPAAEDFTFELLYEDKYMAIINKPPGVVVHPAPGNPDGTVVNALLSRYPELRDADLPDGSRPGIVHRLDKDTSGCLAIARTPEAHAKLCEAFAERATAKTYLALTGGIPLPASGRIENLIGRHPANRQKMAIVQRNGKLAISEYQVKNTGFIGRQKTALVQVKIFTGRTHQIRVHLASLKTPVLGDEIYGARYASLAPRQMLHAWKLAIPHPISGELIKVQAPLPEDFQAIYRQMTEA